MTKPVSRQTKWLTAITLLAVAALLIGGGCEANEPPVISNLTLSADGEINLGTDCSVYCTASDLNEDELTYSWSADGGSFSGAGSSVTWTAPDEAGVYTISVEVSDGREGVDSSELIVNVLTPNSPPVIESLDRDWNNNKLKKATPTNITCTASDPDDDELTYTWSAIDDAGNPVGSFTGEGATVTWTSPNNYGTYHINVVVSDGRGGEATESLNISVCSCGSAQG